MENDIIGTLLAFYYMDLLKLQEILKSLWYFSYINIYDQRKTNLKLIKLSIIIIYNKNYFELYEMILFTKIINTEL